MKRYPRSASRRSAVAWALATGLLSTRLLMGCGDSAQSSVFTGQEGDASDKTSSDVSSPPLGDSGPGPEPGPTPLNAGPPVVPPVCDPSIAREGCDPPESTFPVPATIMVSRDGDAGCRQMIHAETRDGGAFACIIGSNTDCYGPLELGTKYPFTLGHGSSGAVVSGTFTVRFDGDGGVPATVALGGCFDR